MRERDRELVLLLDVLRALAAVERFAVDFLGAALLREAPALADFARRAGAFVAAGFLARDVVLRAAVRTVLVATAALAGASSSIHLPESRRCAASATASAISEPNLVALAATLLAACWAVSAASSPASRILRRADGLALIAAAAAANPAASISLLIAALVNLSTVLLPDFAEGRPEDEARGVRLDDDLEEVFLGDLAISSLPLSRWKDTLAT